MIVGRGGAFPCDSCSTRLSTRIMFDDVPFEASLRSPETPRRGWLFAVHGGRVLVHAGTAPRFPAIAPGAGEAAGLPSPAADMLSDEARWHYLGRLRGDDCWALRLGECEIPGECELRGLRSLFTRVPDELLAVAGRAVQIVEWDETHRFCGRCATPMRSRPGERARECPACGQVNFPRLAPAMMALIRRGDRLLLARAPRFAPGMYSALAGFVEPGESLEQCLRREVREEVGIEVTNIRYFASQPWPFPHSLMIAFNCEYAGGELRLEPAEIEDAQWFALDRLPRLPQPISISRRLIDATIAAMRREAVQAGAAR
jgi:NAD+ diphosphatase